MNIVSKSFNIFVKEVKCSGIPRAMIYFLRHVTLRVRIYFFRQRFSVKIIHTYKLKLDLNDRGISRALYLSSTREKEHIYILQTELKPNYTVLDIGANIGYYALLEESYLTENCTVYALEPVKENFQLLVT